MSLENNIEKEIYERIQYTDKYLTIRGNYIDDGLDTPIFKNPEIKSVFKQLEYKYNNKGNRFIVKREYENYSFNFHFLCRRNITDIYIEIKNFLIE